MRHDMSSFFFGRLGVFKRDMQMEDLMVIYHNDIPLSIYNAAMDIYQPL
jgi:hypothetical protein